VLDSVPPRPASARVADVVGNADVEWDTFDSAAYFDHNYGELRDDDKTIINLVTEHFGQTCRTGVGSAIDVGTGANLYPGLIMLPYSARVVLSERAHSNRVWLNHELAEPSGSWQEFWKRIAEDSPPHQRIRNPFDLLHRYARVERGNIFNLAAGQHDLGTMFFVAESITTRDDEFRRATGLFVNSLKPGAPFAAAFMRNSSGYYVAGQRFPACSINENDVEKALAPVARNVDIKTVESNDLRDGYCGMMVALGRRK